MALLLVAVGCAGSGGEEGFVATQPPASVESVASTAVATTEPETPLAPVGGDAPAESEAQAAEEPSVISDANAADQRPAELPVRTAQQLEDCAVPLLPAFGPSPFRFIAEENVFQCLGVNSYQFKGALELESDVGQEFDSIDFNSQATLVDGEARYFSFGAVDQRPYEATRLGDTVWVLGADGSLKALDVGGVEAFALFELESTVAQMTLAGVGINLIAFYAGGAIMVGAEEIEGRPVERWTAGPTEIADHVNASGLLPVHVEVRSGSIDVWTDADGLVLRAEADLEADDITLNGVPAMDFPGAVDSGLIFDGLYSFKYFGLDEPLSIEAPAQ